MLTPSDDAAGRHSAATWAATIAGRRIAWPANRAATLLLVGSVFVLLWGLPRLVMPLATDQFYFALGARTVLDGDQLYRDLWDLKPPLIYLIYALPAAVLGEHVEAFRLLDLANTLLAMAGVFLFTRRLFNERSAIAAAGLYGFAYLTASGVDGMGQNESFMVAPLMFGLAVYPGPGERRHAGRWALAAGLLLGLVIAIKFSGAVFLLALPAMELLLRREAGFDVRGAVARLAAAAAGVAIIQAAWIAYLLAAGVLDDFIELQRDYVIPYSNERWAPFPLSYPRFLLEATADWFRANAYLIVPVLAAFVLGLYRG
jgi:4-amino-4-deoxy-L-arabinose transferase-like glycosyltransferase